MLSSSYNTITSKLCHTKSTYSSRLSYHHQAGLGVTEDTGSTQRFQLKIENKELFEQNIELQNSVYEVEKRRYQAGNLGEEQVELLIYDMNE